MTYKFADCILDTHLHTLHRAGRVQQLRPKVFQMLTYLQRPALYGVVVLFFGLLVRVYIVVYLSQTHRIIPHSGTHGIIRRNPTRLDTPHPHC
jgi:hypothetical protein